MAFLLAAIAALSALILAPGQFFYFDITPKVVVLLTGVALAALLAARGLRESVPRLLSLLLLLNTVSLAVSTWFGVNRNLSLYGGTWRRFGLAEQAAVMLFAWLVAGWCGTAGRMLAMLRAIAVAGTIAALYGIAQYVGWDPLIPKGAYHIGEGVWTIVRPPGTLGYASYFANWLLMALFLGLELARREPQATGRRLALLGAAVMLIAMLLTGTRAGILGLAAGIAVWAIGSRVKISKTVIVLLLIAGIAAIGFYLSPPGLQMRSRARWFAEDPWGGARFLLWRDSLAMARYRLISGSGPETFLPAFPYFESKDLARAYPDFVHESPHNIFLDALVSQGIPGLAILAVLCAAAWLSGRKRSWFLPASLTAGIAAQQFTVFTVPTAILFFTIVALSFAVDSGPSPRRLASLRFAFPFAAALFFYLAFRLAAADHALAAAKHRLDSGDVRAATTAYREYDRWRLPGTSADVWLSRSLMDAARNTTNIAVIEEAASRAEEAAERAVQTAEDPFNAWYNLAEIRAVHNDYPGTEQSLRAAIAAHPVWFKPHWMLAQILGLESRLDEAVKEATLAVELDGGKDAEVSLTLAQIRSRL
jgi:O-antigen ligase